MSDFMTVVIRMPREREQRAKIVQALSLGREFHGGRITAVSCEDEITKVEGYEKEYGDIALINSIEA